MKVVIVDDDPRSHRVLESLLKDDHPDIDIVGSGYNIADGLNLIRLYQPELVFLDVELPEGLGFDLLAKLPDVQFHVIFITAHDKYAITAIRFGALDFLLKPFTKEELANALDRARDLEKKQISEDEIRIIIESYEKAQQEQLPSRLVVRSQAEIQFLIVDKIIRLEAQGFLTLFYTDGVSQPIVSTYNLGKHGEQFELYSTFAQVHRKHIVNLNYVKRFIKGERVIEMHDGSQVDVSRTYLEDFLEEMGKL